MAALLIAAAITLVYARSFAVPFVFDDVDAILNNRHVRQLWPPWVAWDAPPDLPVSGRPLVALSLALNHALGGYRVAGYHAFNLLVHVGCALLLWACLRRTVRSEGFALFVALAWGVHPLISEAVVYVIQRTELMVSFFGLAALYAALRSFEPSARRGWQAACVAACALAALCKEVAFAIPVVVLLADRAFSSGSFRAALVRHRWLHAGCFASWLLVLWSVLGGARARSVGTEHGVTAFDYLATQAGVILWYLRASFVPAGLSVSHGWPIVESHASAWPELLCVGALFVAALWLTARRPALGMPALGFFLVLAPSSSFVPIVTEVAAERRMYLPLAAVITLVALGLQRLSRERSKPVLAGLGALAIATLAATTWARVGVWTDPVALWADAAAKNPRDATAHNNLAKAFEQAGDRAAARAEYELAIELEPDDPIARANLAMLLAQDGDFDGAVAQLERARQLDPGFAGALHNLGTIAAMREDWEAAIGWFEQALELAPNHHRAHNNLALALEHVGRTPEARAHLERVCELEPRDPAAHHTLGLFLARNAQWADAERELAEALSLDPSNAACREQLAAVRSRL